MRSPLSAFHLQVQLLRTDAQAFTAPRAQKIVERLDRSYRRLAEMVETVLEQSRIQAGRALPRLQQVDLVKSATDVVEELRPEAEGKGLKLSVTSQISEGSLETDPTFLRLILVNLLGNAIKFTRSGSIDVALLIGGKEFRVKVRDDGPGIPAQDHQRIFEPFVRLESFEHTHTDGFGLGLANAKRLSEALLGRIELESKPGLGSTFTLVLPAEPQGNT
jgi:signal transduction histidine kinase